MWCNDHVSLVAASNGRHQQSRDREGAEPQHQQQSRDREEAEPRHQQQSRNRQGADYIGIYGFFEEAQLTASGKLSNPVQSIFAYLLAEATPYFYRSCNEFLRSPRRCPTPYVRMAL